MRTIDLAVGAFFFFARVKIGAALSTGRIALNGSGDELLHDPPVRAVYLGV